MVTIAQRRAIAVRALAKTRLGQRLTETEQANLEFAKRIVKQSSTVLAFLFELQLFSQTVLILLVVQ